MSHVRWIYIKEFCWSLSTHTYHPCTGTWNWRGCNSEAIFFSSSIPLLFFDWNGILLVPHMRRIFFSTWLLHVIPEGHDKVRIHQKRTFQSTRTKLCFNKITPRLLFSRHFPLKAFAHSNWLLPYILPFMMHTSTSFAMLVAGLYCRVCSSRKGYFNATVGVVIFLSILPLPWHRR